MATLRTAFCLAGLAGCVLVFILAGKETDRNSPQVTQYVLQSPQPSPAEPEFDVEAFISDEIEPLIRSASEREEECLRAALRLLDSEVADYSRGIKPLVEDLTGLGTRFGIIGRTVKDKWNSAMDSASNWWNDRRPNSDKKYEEAAKFVKGKFRHHFVNEARLRRTLNRVIHQYTSDIKASREQLFGEIRKATESTPLGVEVTEERFDHFVSRVNERADRLASNLGKDSMKGGLVAFIQSMVAGIVAEEVARRLMTSILTGACTTVSTSALVSSSVAVKATLVSSAAGTTAGPAGTMVGAGIGLVVGLLVDWWSEGKVKKDLTRKCHEFLRTLQGGMRGSAERIFKELSKETLKLQKNALAEEFRAAANRQH